MGEAKRRGTRAERVAQGQHKRAVQAQFAPAVYAARRDPRWKTEPAKPQRRALIVEHAKRLGILPKDEP